MKLWLSITDQFDVRYIASQIPYGTAMLVRLLLCIADFDLVNALNAGGREVYPAAAAARSFQTTEVEVCEEEEYRSYHATGDHEAVPRQACSSVPAAVKVFSPLLCSGARREGYGGLTSALQVCVLL